MTIYLETDRTRLRLPVFVADSLEELSEHSGQSVKEIKRQLRRSEKDGSQCRFVRIEIEDDDDELE